MSDKCKLIDQTTFERLQQSTSNASSSSSHKVRNAKYKRMSTNAGFDLMQFLKPKPPIEEGGIKKGNWKPRRSGTDNIKGNVAKKGKQRENAKQRRSRLKKSILRYRQKKNQEQQPTPLEEATDELQELAVPHEDVNKVDAKVVQIHSRRFREYCNTCCTPDLKKHTELLLRELYRFQRRAHALNEIKAKAHRRIVVGFREVQNHLRINKVRLVVIATDCEKCEGEEGLNLSINTIKTMCQDQNIPIAFAFERRKLAYILYKKASISCVGILDYDGARDIFAELLVALKQAQDDYEELKREAAMLSQCIDDA